MNKNEKFSRGHFKILSTRQGWIFCLSFNADVHTQKLHLSVADSDNFKKVVASDLL